jgi:hypothetical protein
VNKWTAVWSDRLTGPQRVFRQASKNVTQTGYCNASLIPAPHACCWGQGSIPRETDCQIVVKAPHLCSEGTGFQFRPETNYLGWVFNGFPHPVQINAGIDLLIASTTSIRSRIHHLRNILHSNAI